MKRLRVVTQILGLTLLIAFAAFAQSVASPRRFEVAVVKVNKSGANWPGDHILPSGLLNFNNATARELTMWAYDVRLQYVTGGPRWLDTDRFDITAKAPPNTSINDARIMLRELLADRFKLSVRQEQKVMSVFALIVEDDRLALTPAATSGQAQCRRGSEHGIQAQHHVRCTNLTLSELAEYLPDLAVRDIDYAVVDLTGITGRYDFNLDFRLDWAPKSHPAESGASTVDSSSNADDGPTIFEDLDKQFGLKLERHRQAMPIVVITGIEHIPSEN